jgi:tetratricopeptide (TPR) repeat protein
MKKLLLIISVTLLSLTVKAQEERKLIRQGNNAYHEKKYPEAEEWYRKAIDKKPRSLEANYNVGNVLYRQNKYLDAASKYNALTDYKMDNKEKAFVYHNMGNSYLKANKIQESISAYKNALKLNPTDRETKFNLAYAQRMLMQQQQQQQQQNNKQDQKNKEQQNKDQQKKDQQNKEQQNKEQQNKDQQNNQDSQQGRYISQEDANRILEAMQNEEKELHKKLQMEKVQKQRGKTLKNW